MTVAPTLWSAMVCSTSTFLSAASSLRSAVALKLDWKAKVIQQWIFSDFSLIFSIVAPMLGSLQLFHFFSFELLLFNFQPLFWGRFILKNCGLNSIVFNDYLHVFKNHFFHPKYSPVLSEFLWTFLCSRSSFFICHFSPSFDGFLIKWKST